MMSSLGTKLQRERERGGSSLEQAARATGIGRPFLEALEREEFDSLPGPAFGKLYIRAYAELFGFDAEPLIVEYDLALARARRAARGGSDQPADPAPEPTTAGTGQSRVRRRRRTFEPEEGSTPRGPQRDSRAASAEATAVEPAAPDVEAEATAVEPAAPDVEAEATAVEPAAPDVEADAEADADPSGERVAVTATPHRRRSLRPRVVAVAVAGAALSLILVLSSLRDDRVAGEEVGRTVASEDHGAQTTAPPPAVPAESPAADPAPVVAEVSTHDGAGTLRVDDFGVGSRVVNRRLQEAGEVFAEGAVAWFSTRVVGGSAGQRIRHVWLRDGHAIQSIELPLGGPHWRTHSNKTLWGTGEWSVEARDAQGRLLARARFSCVRGDS